MIFQNGNYRRNVPEVLDVSLVGHRSVGSESITGISCVLLCLRIRIVVSDLIGRDNLMTMSADVKGRRLRRSA